MEVNIIKLFKKITAYLLIVSVLFFSSCSMEKPKVPDINVVIPNDFNWNIAHNQLLPENFEIKTELFDFSVPIQFRTAIDGAYKRINNDENFFGEIVTQKYVALNFIKDYLDINITYDGEYFTICFRYLKILLMTDSDRAIFFTPFDTYEQYLNAPVRQIREKVYIPLKLLDILGFCSIDSIGRLSTIFIEPRKCISVTYNSLVFENINSSIPKNKDEFYGTLVAVAPDGSGIYKQKQDGDEILYLHYDSKLYLYTHNLIVPNVD